MDMSSYYYTYQAALAGHAQTAVMFGWLSCALAAVVAYPPVPNRLKPVWVSVVFVVVAIMACLMVWGGGK